MTFYSQLKRNEDKDQLIKAKLEQFSIREVYLWKKMVLKDPELFSHVYNLIYCDNPRIAWHAAWVIDHASEEEPSMLEPYVDEIIDQLPDLKSSSLKRHFTRMLISQEIPEDKLGMMVDLLYKLATPAEAIAVQANSLELLYRIVLRVPELKSELVSFIEGMLEDVRSPGMNSKGKNILRSLKRQ